MASLPQGYAALHDRAAWLVLTGRGNIRVTGEDRARLLHAMTTNHVHQLQPGQGCYAYFLSAQGRILADVNIFCREEELLLDTEPETREKVFRHLDKFIIADDVLLEDVTDAYAALAIEGPSAGTVLANLGAPAPGKDHEITAWGDRLVTRTSFTGGPGYWILLPANNQGPLTALLTSAGAEPASPEAFEIVRIEHGKPRYGQDLTERFLAQEANQPHALNFNKGCYLGQEIVERVRSRGQIHRVLVPIEIEGSDVPAAGMKLALNGSSFLEITSAAYSPERGKVVALAYVRTDHAKPGTELDLGQYRVRIGTARVTDPQCV